LSDESQFENPIDPLAEDFVARLRRGERPSLTEYTTRHPALAAEIRELFPALVLMEKARPAEPGKASLANQISGFEKLPERLDDYRIVREIGRGGMGVVYEAIQESLGRRVALKVLPRQFRVNDAQAQRFQRESRAAARLNHPNIVPIFGVGETDGIHYYAMQFIRGLGLDQVTSEIKRLRADRLKDRESVSKGPTEANVPSDSSELSSQSAKALAAGVVSGVFPNGETRTGLPLSQNEPSSSGTSDFWGSSKTLTIRESGRTYWNSIARIGEEVALALQYAADEGVLHRDIKPANLMLDLEGKVWLTDFGLATELAGDGLTQTGDIIGTLRYMAPERLKGVSSPLVDVYSLGATLYELLTLTPMFGHLPREQMLQAVSSASPTKPRSIDSRIPQDLETIILKALSKEPSDRYAGAKQMAEDLRRFLDGKPILARGASALDQVGKWFRRNPVVAGLLSILAVLLPLLFVGAWVSNLVRMERDEAIYQRELATEARQKSDALFERARIAEQESRVRAHLGRANALQNSGKEGQRFHCLAELKLAASLSPPDSLRRELADCAISALGLSDIQPKFDFDTDFTGPSCFNHSGTQFVQVATDKTVSTEQDSSASEAKAIDGDYSLRIRSSDDWHRTKSLPGPGFPCTYALIDYTIDDQFLIVTYIRWQLESRMICYNAQTYEVVHSSDISTMAFNATIAHHPNGRVIAYGNSEAELIFWDLVERKELRRLKLGYKINDLCFDSVGTELALIASDGKAISFIDVETGAEKRRFQSPDPNRHGLVSLSWSSDDQLIAASRADASIDVWSVPQQRLCSIMEGHLSLITNVSFSKKGHLLCTKSYDGSSRLWDASRGKELLVSERHLLGFIQDDQLAFTTGHRRTAGICSLSHEDAIRRLHNPSIGNSQFRALDQGILWATFSPDVTLALVYGASFLDFWDVNKQRFLHRLSIDDCHRVLFHPSGNYFVTLQRDQLLKWPVHRRQAAAESVVHCGPPETVQVVGSDSVPANLLDACWLKEGEHLAIFSDAKPEVLIKNMSLSKSAEQIDHLPSRYPSAVPLAASPDGKWLAAGSYRYPGVQVWDLNSHENHEIVPNPLDTTQSYTVGFTSDSRWLIVTVAEESTEGGHAIYEAGTWKRHDFRPTQASPGLPVLFQKTSRLAAMTGPNTVRISDVASGDVITTLGVTAARFNAPIGLLDNDTKLAMVSAEAANDILIWDFAEIKKSLQQLGLKWDLEIADRSNANALSSVRFSIDDADIVEQTRLKNAARESLLKAEALVIASKVDEAIVLIESIQSLSSQSPVLMNNISWDIASRRECTLTQAVCAVKLVEQSISLEPNERQYLNTLGVACYRNGEFDRAIECLTRSVASAPKQNFFYDAVFLAMSKWQLGQYASAREWFSKSRVAFEHTPTPSEEMKRFLAEAEALIE